jgi:hypothetical protein
MNEMNPQVFYLSRRQMVAGQFADPDRSCVWPVYPGQNLD